jgi:aspartate carbamoyltransferase catalytic subunit
MMNSFFNRDVISIRDFSKDDLQHLFAVSDKIEKASNEMKISLAPNKTMAMLFFEPSTRTRLSFESAILLIGGHALGFAEPKSSSVEKGENLADTIRVVESYCDLLVMRHYLEGAARFAAETANKPLINAGSGTEEHPTQAMLDIYSIIKEKGDISGLNISVLGDLKYGRTVYSLLYGLSKWKPSRVNLISPSTLKVRSEAVIELAGQLNIHETENLDDVISQSDVFYVTRIQKERFPDPHDYEKVKGSYIIDRATMEKAKSDSIVLHPLPRVGEIADDLDNTPHAKYFLQSARGRILRAALITLILNRDLPSSL